MVTWGKPSPPLGRGGMYRLTTNHSNVRGVHKECDNKRGATHHHLKWKYLAKCQVSQTPLPSDDKMLLDSMIAQVEPQTHLADRK